MKFCQVLVIVFCAADIRDVKVIEHKLLYLLYEKSLDNIIILLYHNFIILSKIAT